MAIYSTSRDIPLAPEQVFDFLADPRNLPIWKYSGVEEVDSSPDGAGFGAQARYRFPGRHRFHTLTCDLYDPPRLIGFTGQRMWTPLGCQTPSFLFQLRPSPLGCTVELRVRIRLAGALLLLRPVVALGWHRDLPEDGRRLYEALAPLATTRLPAEPAPGTAAGAPAAPPAGEPVRNVASGTAFA